MFTESLLMYDTPVLVSKKTEESPKLQRKISGPDPCPPKPKSPSSDVIKQQTEELLNAMLPPREWRENDQLWVQKVSSTPCTRTDIIHLQEELDLKLQQRKANDTGVCPVRRELYTQCFDELVRQVTINCAERGLLLLRVRDEIRMTISSYQNLYESSVAFGMRKALEAEKEKSDNVKRIADLADELTELERQLNEKKAECEEMERQANERRLVEEQKHAEEIESLKYTNLQIKDQLNTVITQM
ncbi:axonemal dynein light intermediate polypeptide 1-like [Ictalurus furcatus]|uniref:axonemal dynein light intermediate polypeptide 1-like n=1 Tax=Ictalurus furcatus TaxID=66913 RepID=UPI00235028CF|nr:axonemal dynein light intermediate polypeptide 1-like [Ictalurus furcatus]